jgi:hypothetical protein
MDNHTEVGTGKNKGYARKHRKRRRIATITFAIYSWEIWSLRCGLSLIGRIRNFYFLLQCDVVPFCVFASAYEI